MSSAAAQILAQVDGFSNLNEDELEIIANLALPKKYTLGSIIVNEGDHSDELYVIFKGQVSIDFKSYNNTAVNICRIGEQQLFGELAYLDDQPRSATATTTMDSKILVLGRDLLNECFNDNPTIGYKVMTEIAQIVTRKLRFTNLALKDKASQPQFPT
tara:strand:- start:622 stop:1095 length:474 start_codon:yes stop_codon:yes gene_type:complete